MRQSHLRYWSLLIRMVLPVSSVALLTTGEMPNTCPADCP